MQAVPLPRLALPLRPPCDFSNANTRAEHSADAACPHWRLSQLRALFFLAFNVLIGAPAPCHSPPIHWLSESCTSESVSAFRNLPFL
ncbi:uncharacterized protein C8Q71DRAFT_821504 [Rhodofomes roseus]|uniref:Uncharacterized protein n=1 Tax=Rhodofomes roseus TaxID=34475 RepID=A0ABQ8KN35_9APHY|nr:uncharacterized protein C8Q71DRAFT_821504 [Rhodofomes roseus]KAH9839529.1 hypothetical protein C8Q71DRAFT_821504 [Rhodofomes roseus]